MAVLMRYITADDRKGWAIMLGIVLVVLTVSVLGALVAHHVNPCHPGNIGRCGRRLGATLHALGSGRLTPSEEAAAICPSLVDTLDCYYWFSQRCLPGQHFYAKAYVEASAAVEGLCLPAEHRDGPEGPALPSLLETHGACLRWAREQRGECGQHHFLDGDLIDSLYDDRRDTFTAPLCRSLRDYILCGLQLVRASCGLGVALQLQDLHANLTNLLFTHKCDADLRPVLILDSPPLLLHQPLDVLPTLAVVVLVLFGLLGVASLAQRVKKRLSLPIA